MRRVILAVAFIGLGASAAKADTAFLVLPTQYNPGAPFTVQVGIGPVGHLLLYSIDVVVQTVVPVAGQLSLVPPAAASSNYIFSLAHHFSATVTAPDAMGYRINLAESIQSHTPPDVVPGVNDRVATLTFQTSPTLTGPIQFVIDQNTLIVEGDGFGEVSNNVARPKLVPAGPAVSPQTVPEPSAILASLIGGLAIVARSMRYRLTTR